MPEIDIAFSSCPNDTFMFHAMLHGRIDVRPFSFVPHIDDIETLNTAAFDRTHQVTKLSCYAYLQLKDHYDLLDSGAAIGYGCGPLLVARSPLHSLQEARIAIPGMFTTAHLLLKLWRPGIQNVYPARFDTILPGIVSGTYDAGLIIHEGRFIYHEYDCINIIDLGEWWEAETGLPIPLGCIAIRRDPSTIRYKQEIESILKSSITYGLENRHASRDYVKAHAQELSDDVIDNHINLYVNDFSVSLSEAGMNAFQSLENRAKRQGLI